jgi:hypothetical protein
MVDINISNHEQEEEVAPTKVKAFNERHQPKKSKPINKAKGGKEGRNQEHPRQSLTNFITTKENKEGVVSEGSIVRVFHSGTGSAQD